MGKAKARAFGAFAFLLLAPAPLHAGILIVKADRERLATGYYLVPQSVVEDALPDRQALYSQVSRYRPLALNDALRLPADYQVYVFPSCDHRPFVRAFVLITANGGQVRLTCRLR
jgi:hypothetical protein